MQQRNGFVYVPGAQAELLAGDGVLGIIQARAAKQNEPVLHSWFWIVNQSSYYALGRSGRVSVKVCLVVAISNFVAILLTVSLTVAHPPATSPCCTHS